MHPTQPSTPHPNPNSTLPLPFRPPESPLPPQAYTSQIVALTMTALLLGSDSVAKTPKRLAAIRALEALPDAVRGALKLDRDMHKLAEGLKDAQSLML